MDSFSAIVVVVVPFILESGAPYAWIRSISAQSFFIASLELRYLTPLVGLSLFLAPWRFTIIRPVRVVHPE